MPTDRDRVWALSLVEQQPPAAGEGVVEWLNRLCRAVSLEVDVRAATVTMGPPGARSAVVAANEPDYRRYAEIEFGVGEGPAHDAWADGRPVLVPDLGGPLDGAWPGYTPVALTADVRAVFAFPLQVGAARLGVLALFNDHSGQLTRTHRDTCLALADLATERLINSTEKTASADIDPDLGAALGFRSEIYQAQGMVAVALGVSLVDALVRVRGHAFGSGRAVIDVAVDIVENGLRLDKDAPQHDEEN